MREAGRERKGRGRREMRERGDGKERGRKGRVRNRDLAPASQS